MTVWCSDEHNLLNVVVKIQVNAIRHKTWLWLPIWTSYKTGLRKNTDSAFVSLCVGLMACSSPARGANPDRRLGDSSWEAGRSAESCGLKTFGSIHSALPMLFGRPIVARECVLLALRTYFWIPTRVVFTVGCKPDAATFLAYRYYNNNNKFLFNKNNCNSGWWGNSAKAQPAYH